MNPHRTIIGLALLAALSCAAASVAQDLTSTAFTYQGQLKQAGELFTGLADFHVGLFDVESGGAPRDSVMLTNVSVSDGLFTINLDFDVDSINGDGLWLEIAVAIPPGGAYTTLTPRQAVRPSPYALFALNGVAAELALPYEGTCPYGAGDAFTIVQPNDTASAIIAISQNEDSSALYASAESPNSVAVKALAFGEASPAVVGTAHGTGAVVNYGGLFTAHGDAGRGVYGHAPATSGLSHGVSGRSDSTSGIGVHGWAPATSGSTAGVKGESASPDGAGVWGYNDWDGAGAPIGVYGSTNNPNGFGGYFEGKGYFSDYLGVGIQNPGYTLHVVDISGSAAVYGENPGESTTGALGTEWGGVYGEGAVAVAGVSSSPSGKAVHGRATATSGMNYGVLGHSYSTGGRGVYGYASASSGTPTGVQGETGGADGYGVWGYNDADDGGPGEAVGVLGTTASPGGAGVKGVGGYGVWGRAEGASGRGVFAESTATSGYSIGLDAYAASPDGFGVYAVNEAESGNAIAIRGDSNSGDGFGGYFLGKGYFSNKVGIGTDTPTQMLDVAGTVKMSGFQLSGAPAAGYVLTSNSSGVGTWQAPTGGGSSYWLPCDTGIWYEDGHVGVGAEDPASRLEVFTASDTGAFKAVTTREQSGTTSTAVWGEASSTDAIGVRGHTSATTGTTYGGYFTSATADGYGVWGHNNSTTTQSDKAVGVYGSSASPRGIGVKGYVPGPRGAAVWGRADGTASRGVLAEALGTSGVTAGLEAYAASPDGYAVYASNEGATGDAVAVYGNTSSTAGVGVHGHATAATGTTYGVYGEVESPNGFGGYFLGKGYFSGHVGFGIANPTAPVHAKRDGVAGPAVMGSVTGNSSTGVYGYATDPTHMCIGVRGESGSPLGIGVKGKVDHETGATVGVQGISESPNGKGVEGINTDDGWAGFFQGPAHVSGNLGVGTETPAAKLDVNGTVKMTGFQLASGATSGYVLTCDAGGVATWQEPTGSGSFDLPYDGSVSSTDGSAFSITNTATSGYQTIAGEFQTNSDNGKAVRAQSGGIGAIGVSSEVSGTIGVAVHAVSTGTLGYGMFAQNNSTNPTLEARNYGTGDIIKGFAGSTNVFRVTNNGTTVTNVLQIEGGSDLSEQFNVRAAHAEPEPGMVVCIDPACPGQLIVSTQAYDRKVAGIVSGAGGVQPGMLMGQKGSVADGQHPVALTGRVYVWADASGGAIEPGDLLTTSDIAGHAMKVSDNDQAQGAILGKAMTSLEEGRGLVLVLVTLQ